MNATCITGKKKSPRIRGICEAAKTLGVSRVHLLLVLKGKRVSRTLSRRYLKLQGAQKKATRSRKS